MPQETEHAPKWVDHAVCFTKPTHEEPIQPSKWFYPPEYQRQRTSTPRGADVMNTRWNHWEEEQENVS